MARLILVKHSAPDIVRHRPRREWHLSPEGVEACSALAERLARYAPTRIVASPEPKARETAAAVAAALAISNVRTLRGLREQDDGDIPFVGEAGFRASVASFFAHPSVPAFGTETADAAHARFSAAVARAVRCTEGGSVIAVAHGRVISLFAARRNDLDPYGLWLRLGFPSFIVLRVPDYQIEEVVERL